MGSEPKFVSVLPEFKKSHSYLKPSRTYYCSQPRSQLLLFTPSPISLFSTCVPAHRPVSYFGAFCSVVSLTPGPKGTSLSPHPGLSSNGPSLESTSPAHTYHLVSLAPALISSSCLLNEMLLLIVSLPSLKCKQ